jgi:hypothetical protein
MAHGGDFERALDPKDLSPRLLSATDEAPHPRSGNVRAACSIHKAPQLGLSGTALMNEWKIKKGLGHELGALRAVSSRMSSYSFSEDKKRWLSDEAIEGALSRVVKSKVNFKLQ